MKQKIISENAPKADTILSQAIISNGLIFVAGQIHTTPDGKLIDGSVEQKLAQIMKNIDEILKSAGSNLNSVVKATVYVTNLAILIELNKFYPTYFEDPLPAREAVCVTALPLGATIEISVIATI